MQPPIDTSIPKGAPRAQENTWSVVEDGALTKTLGITNPNTHYSLTYELATLPTSGTLTLNDSSTGAFSYNPSANFNGSDSFTFKVTDPTYGNSTARVVINVTAVNDVPVANAATFDVVAGTSLSRSVTGTDVDGDPLSFVLKTSPTKGVLALASNGGFVYSPAVNSFGPDSFTFAASDGTANSADAVVTLDVKAPAPVAMPLTTQTPEDTALNGTLAVINPNPGQRLTYSIVSQPAKGVVALTNATSGAYTYTPNANANGADGFDYRVTDAVLGSTTSRVSISVAAVNDPPVANAGSFQVTAGATLSQTVSGSDIEGSALTFTVRRQPTKGTLTANSDGRFTFAANSDGIGADSFTFVANDGALSSPEATVTLNISAPTPVAAALSLTAIEDTALNGTLSIANPNPGLTLTYSMVNPPIKGTLSTLNSQTGAFVYTPSANYFGGDSFTYRVADPAKGSSTAQVSITVASVNDAPVVTNSAVSVVLGRTATGSFIVSDVEADALTYTITRQPSKGVVSTSGGGFAYTSTGSVPGTDSFGFKANDGQALSNEGTVSITITAPVVTPPVAVAQSLSAYAGEPVQGTLGIAVPGVAQYRIGSQPTKGTVAITAATGAFTYTPHLSSSGPDSFSFIATNSGGDSAPATVSISIVMTAATFDADPFRIRGLHHIFRAMAELDSQGNSIRPTGNIPLDVVNNGVSRVLIAMPWDLVEPVEFNPSCTNGERYKGIGCYTVEPHVDEAIRKYAAAGIRVTTVLVRMPEWARISCNHPFPGWEIYCAPQDQYQSRYGNFAGFIAQKYKGMIDTFIINNEVNSSIWYRVCSSCDLGTRTSSYALAFNATYDAIKAVQPTANVLIPFTSNFSHPESGGESSIKDFMTSLVPKLGSREWKIAHHPYSNSIFSTDFSPDDVGAGNATMGSIGALEGWLARTYPDKPHAQEFYLTEFAFYGTNQAAQNEAICRSLRAALGTSGVRQYLYYAFEDNPGEEVTDAAGNKVKVQNGLVQRNNVNPPAFSYRQSWGTFARANKPGSLSCGFETVGTASAPKMVLQRGYHTTRGHWITTRLLPSGFNRELAWQVDRSPQPGTKPLFECMIVPNGNNFAASHTFPSTAASCEAPGVIPMGRLGYVYEQAQPGTVPLYRCASPPDRADHLVNSGGCPSGWFDEGLLGHAVPIP